MTFQVILLFLFVSSDSICYGDSGDSDIGCDRLVNTTYPPPKIIPGQADSLKKINFFLCFTRTINKYLHAVKGDYEYRLSMHVGLEVVVELRTNQRRLLTLYDQ